MLACLWSGSFIGIKEVVKVWPPLFGAAARVGIAVCSLTVLVYTLRKNRNIPYSIRCKLWVIGLFSQAIPFSFLFWGERLIAPGLAGILNGTTPIWTFIFALIFFPQATEFSILRTLGLLIGIMGIVIIFWPIMSFDKNIDSFLGAGAVLVMAMSYAVGGLLNQHFLKSTVRIDFLTNVYYQHWASVTYLIIASLIFEKWPGVHYLFAAYTPWVASIYLGVFSTAIAYAIFYHLIREWDALRASSVLYLVPVLALVWDYLFFGNEPGRYEIMGVIGVLLGMVLISMPTNIRKIH
jgi:drug/metabolite transporter (DMT)-like permease